MILEVHGGRFEYLRGQPLFKNIDFHLDRGEIMAVMGRNGIGKTTLVKCIVGLLPWTQGYSAIDGVKSQVNKPMKSIGYVPQAHKVSFSYSVRDMVVFGKVGHQSFLAAPEKNDYVLADSILEKTGIYRLRDHPCNELSGGQLQLVFIARALINSPKLLVLDEPEAHLDFRNQIRLLKLIRNVAAENNIACIINTHYPNHALRIANQCFLLGEEDYIKGGTAQVMTDENIQKYFGVYSHSHEFPYKGETITAYSFLDEV